MTTNVQAGLLTFPDRVVKHCHHFDSNGTGYMWAHACSGHRQEHAAPDSEIGLVMANHPELMPDEQDPKARKDVNATPVDVLALALSLKSQGHSATIISEEPLSLPDRDTLATVAPKFGISVKTLEDYMIGEGLAQHLAA
ncbi:hypothetical protein [Arthrobacter sp. ISL-65]|uniref:hypothetical protein n=1 Tax=Arthrobacter sp. ISL-65 TaxID=2819112 RepID=UPI001BE5440E|nr:hypothetical protein [Arthrobacter sp. ISL-65]MBT2550539.1 hypothetical protein [Arthrobacter sp. ISL-65]